MTKKQLLQLKESVAWALSERQASGDFDANSKHMRLLLSGMLELVDHAISNVVKPEKK
jgi:hypothetical protein